MPHSLAHWWVDSFVLSLRAGHRANAPVNPLLDGPVTGSWLSGPDCRASGSWPAGPPARLVTGSRLGDGNGPNRGQLTRNALIRPISAGFSAQPEMMLGGCQRLSCRIQEVQMQGLPDGPPWLP